MSSHTSKFRLKGTAGALANQTFRLTSKLLIGRSDECDIRIDHDSVDARQVEILLTRDGAVRLHNLGRENATRLNGEPVSDAILSGGDEIQVGHCRLMLQAPGLRPDRVLASDAVRPRVSRWPFLLAVLLISASLLAWKYGYLDRFLA